MRSRVTQQIEQRALTVVSAGPGRAAAVSLDGDFGRDLRERARHRRRNRPGRAPRSGWRQPVGDAETRNSEARPTANDDRRGDCASRNQPAPTDLAFVRKQAGTRKAEYRKGKLGCPMPHAPGLKAALKRGALDRRGELAARRGAVHRRIHAEAPARRPGPRRHLPRRAADGRRRRGAHQRQPERNRPGGLQRDARQPAARSSRSSPRSSLVMARRLGADLRRQGGHGRRCSRTPKRPPARSSGRRSACARCAAPTSPISSRSSTAAERLWRPLRQAGWLPAARLRRDRRRVLRPRARRPRAGLELRHPARLDAGDRDARRASCSSGSRSSTCSTS